VAVGFWSFSVTLAKILGIYETNAINAVNAINDDPRVDEVVAVPVEHRDFLVSSACRVRRDVSSRAADLIIQDRLSLSLSSSGFGHR